MKLKTEKREITGTKNCFFKTIKKTDNPLARLAKLKRELTQITNIGTKRHNHYRPCRFQKENKGITTNNSRYKFDSLNKMDQFLKKKHKLPQLSQYEMHNKKMEL